MLFIAGLWVCVCASLRVLLSLSISVSVSVTIFVSVLVFVPRHICMTGRPSGLPRVFGALELAEQIPARGANGGVGVFTWLHDATEVWTSQLPK